MAGKKGMKQNQGNVDTTSDVNKNVDRGDNQNLSDQQIDTEIATRTMDGGKSITEEEVEEAFSSDQSDQNLDR